MTCEDLGGRPATADPTGEDPRKYSASLARAEDVDPIAGLIRQLEHAARCCGSVPLRDGSAVQISRVAGGYAIGTRP